MTALIQECQDELVSQLGSMATPNIVYGYRTIPNKQANAVMVTYEGGEPTPLTIEGQRRQYDFIILLTSQYDMTEASQEAAEQSLNAMENEALTILAPLRNTYWKKITYPRRTNRPPSPPALKGIRVGQIYVRLHLA